MIEINKFFVKALVSSVVIIGLATGCTKTQSVSEEIYQDTSSQTTKQDTLENNDEKKDEIINENTSQKTEIDEKGEKEDDQVQDKEEVQNQKEEQEKEDETIQASTQNKVEIDYQKVRPNEIGPIFVVMYHGIMDLPPYQRTAEDFKKDLQYMYDHGYRPISMKDYLANNITVEAGLTPIVLTFDDGLPTTFSLVDENGQLRPKEGTAVAMLEEFAANHPGFEAKATFYINGNLDAFEGAGTYDERLSYLLDNGYDIGNHTNTHPHLWELNAEQVQKEIGKVSNQVTDIFKDYKMNTIAFPYGERPDSQYLDLVRVGEYNGKGYENLLAFRVGFSAPYVGPNDKRFQPLNHPRLTAAEGSDWDLWYAFNYYDNLYPSMKYISDGDSERISVPKRKENNVNKDSLNGKELYLYE